MNSNEKTIITTFNEKVLHRDLSPTQILYFLENGVLCRGFKNMVSKAYPGDDAEKVIREKLPEMTGESADSIRKNVSNWFADKNLPRRDRLFQISFALGLDDEGANILLSYASDAGIHYRNPEEIIYAYCLKFGRSYSDALKLTEELLPICGDYRNTKQFSAENVKYTKVIRNDFETKVVDDSTLRSFLETNAANFAAMHLTAYEDFIKMLDYLLDPEKEYDDSDRNYQKKHRDEYSEGELAELAKHEKGLSAMSVKDMVAEYMQMHVPENTSKGAGKAKKEKNYSPICETIKKNWPSESIIAKMRNRDIDVSRKVMLLLFLLTEEFEVSAPAGMDDDDMDLLWTDEFDDAGEDSNEIMEMRITQINLFLDNYGMKSLDPGNPFDFLILYSLKAGYEDDEDFMSGRLDELLGMMFPED